MINDEAHDADPNDRELRPETVVRLGSMAVASIVALFFGDGDGE